MFLLKRFIALRGPDEHITKVRTVATITNWLHRCCEQCGCSANLTAHGLRAGWASARLLSGQGISDLQQDGRWKSKSSLQVYLDVIASETDQEQGVAPLTAFGTQLQATFYYDWYWF